MSRYAAAALFLAIGVTFSVSAAQTIPPTTPTTTPATSRPAQPPPVERARVDYRNNLLTVDAANSSLNQILRDIGRATGMRITGGVNDERVFGTYGPADISTILGSLLTGTGSNMMLVEDAQRTPRELVLTPRQGGVTPPNPNAYHDPEPPPRQDLPPQQTPRISNQPAAQPQPPGMQPPTQPPATAATTAPDPSAADTTQQSPNGVKTPQQIYEQLLKLQQQQTKPPPL